MDAREFRLLLTQDEAKGLVEFLEGGTPADDDLIAFVTLQITRQLED